MGMPVEVECHDPIAADAVDAVFAWLRRVDATFSTYRADSEISRIARGELTATSTCAPAGRLTLGPRQGLGGRAGGAPARGRRGPQLLPLRRRRRRRAGTPRTRPSLAHRHPAPAPARPRRGGGPDLGTADAYATAAFAMGAGGPEWTRGIAPYQAMTVLADEHVLLTPGFEDLRVP